MPIDRLAAVALAALIAGLACANLVLPRPPAPGGFIASCTACHDGLLVPAR